MKKDLKTAIVNLPWIDNTGKSLSGFKSGSRWPHALNANVPQTIIPPLFLGSLTALLKQNSFDCIFIDAIAEKLDKNSILHRIRDCTHLVVELSTPSLENDLDTLKFIRENTDIKLIVCGTHPTILPNSIPNSDYIIRGEYEFSILKLLRNIKDDKTLNSNIIEEQELAPLDAIPFPAWNCMPMEKYLENKGPQTGVERELQLMTSRGCPFKCIFCLWPNVLTHHKVRYRSPAKCVDEIEMLHNKYNIKAFYFNDDTFTLNPKHVKAICEEILRRTLDITWACFGHCATIKDSNLLVLMKQAGCRKIKFGIESGSQKILDYIGKSQNISQIIKSINMTRKAGIAVHSSFTIGYPEESYETINETAKLIRKIRPKSAVVSLITPFPGTPFYEIASKNNLLVLNELEEFSGSFKSTVKSNYLTAQELERQRKRLEKILKTPSLRASFKNLWNFLKRNTIKETFKKTASRLAILRKTGTVFNSVKKDSCFIQCWLPPAFEKRASTIKRIFSMEEFLRSQGITFSYVFPLTRLSALVFFPKILLRWLKADSILVQKFSPKPSVIFDIMMIIKPQRVIYDLDDAIYFPQAYQDFNSDCELIAKETNDMLYDADLVIAANEYIADYSRKLNTDVTIVPTSINTTLFSPAKQRPSSKKDKIVIGWLGGGKSHEAYLFDFLPVIKSFDSTNIKWKFLGLRSCDKLKNELSQLDNVDIDIHDWIDPDKIPDEIRKFDIGIMPMFDDAFTKGKCPTKAFEYMACGIPVVCSDIHCVNTFARDGENIFLASNNKKWAEKISILINSEKTRLKLGAEGRKTVEKLFSINSNAPVLARTIKQFLKKQQ